MNGKSLFGMAAAMLAVWFAVGGSSPALADADFDGCTFYTRLKVNGNSTSDVAPIDTGFKPTGTTSIDAKYRIHSTGVNNCLFCSRSTTDMNSGGPHFSFFPIVDSKPRWDYNKGPSSAGASNTTANPNYRLIVESGTATLYTTLDRSPLMTMSMTAASFSATYPMYLFASYTMSGDTPAGFNNAGRYWFHYLKVYDGPISDGKLLHHYVPCKTSGGKVGVADLVEQKVLLPLQNQTALTVEDSDSIGGVRPILNASAFGSCVSFVASGYEGSETLEEFPVLVRLSEDSPSGFSYDSCAADGSDIRFADADGRLIAHEIDTWDPSGESLIWVNIPKLESGTAFKMYMGGDGTAPTLPASSVWRRAGYHLVNHNNVTATTAGMDSTGSGLVGVKQNEDLAVNSLEGAPMGMVDNQTNNHGWNIANDAKWSAHGGQVTISTWSYRTDVTDGTNRELMGVKGAYHLVNQTPKDGKCQLYYGSTSLVDAVMPVAAGNWMQITATLNGTDARAYQNGVLLGSGTSTAIANVTEKLSCGSEYSGNSRNKGYFDEWRLRWGVSSADWVKAEYDTVMKNDFLAGYMGDPPVPEDWEYSFVITLGDEMKTAIGSGEERDFPVLVRLSESGITGFKYSDFKEADYSDLIFIGQDGKFLDYEVDTWDAGGTSLVWVRVPSFTAASAITCRYGGPKYSHNASKTWKKFVAVVHGGACGIVNASDSGLEVRAESTVVTASGAKVGGGINKATQNAIGVNIKNPYAAGKFTNNRRYSVMSWTKPIEKKNMCHYGGIVNWGSAGFMGVFEKGEYLSVAVSGSHQFASGKGAIVAGEWQHTAFSYDTAAGVLDIFCDGVPALHKTDAKTYTDDGATYWTFGSYANKASSDSFQGEMDELRIYDGLVSAAWIAADYYQMMNADAFVYAEVEQPDPELPGLANVELSVNDAGDVVVSGEVLRHAGEVRITFSSEGELPIVVSLGQVAAGGSFERVVGENDGLIRFTEYTVSVSVSNGEKASQKTFPERVKYGKVRPSDRFEFSVTPSAAVKDRLGSDAYADYPVLVRVPSEALQVVVTGREMKVTDESGTELPWELETIDGDGRALIWVKVPALTALTKLTVCTGGGDNPDNDPTEVWSDYVGVWHLDEAKATTTPNSYGEYTNSTSTVGINGNLAKYSIANEPGIVGKAFRVNDVTTAHIGNYNYGGVWVPGTSALKLGQNFTISGWFKMAANAFYYDHIFYKRASSNNATAPTGAFAIEVNASNNKTFSIDARGVNASASAKNVTNADPFSNWVYLTFVYNGTTCSIYANGAKAGDVTIAAVTDNDAALAFGNNCNIAAGNVGDAAWCGWIDEVRLASGSRTAQRIAMDYLVVTDAGFFDYTDPHLVDPTAPVLLVPEIVRNEDGTFTVTEVIDGNMPEEGSVEIVYRGTKIPMTTGDVAVPATYTAVITPAAEDVTDILEVSAQSAAGIVYRVRSSGFYCGGLEIETFRNASEKGLSNGIWRVMRADSAHELKVSLVKLDTSTATVGVDYVEFPLEVTIPDGMSFAEVSFTPIINLDRDYDTWVDLALTNGAYGIDEVKSAARCTIINYEIPVDANIWTGQTSSKASVGSNWTLGVPDELSAVVFDGDISKADCEWDIDATHKVRSWMQKENYTGTVTIDTTFDDEFPELVIDGDVIIGGGKWTHKGNYANFGGTEKNTAKIDRKYRIVVRIGGDLYLGAGACIDVSERGWGYAMPKAQNAGKAPCHGGWMDNQNWSQEVCGDYREPTELGTGAISQGDWSGKSAIGGGAVKLVVGGVANFEGDLLADGTADTNGNTHRVTGSGGSIWVSARQISGAGRISTSTSAIFGNDQALTPGTGGRMALYTEEPLAKSREKLFCSGVAYSKSGSSSTKISGPGTIFIKDSTMSSGLLYIKQPASVCELSNIRCSTPVTGNWAFDKIVLSGAVQLRVLPGNSLSVPSLNAVVSEGNDTARSAIVVPFGAHFYCGSGNQTVQPGVAFATEEFEFDGDLTVANGAKIGPPVSIYGQSSSYFDMSFSLAVSGSLTVEKGGVVGASKALSYSNTEATRHAAHGGQSLWNSYHDGGYDSIMKPSMPGASNNRGFKAGGVMRLVVGGELRVDGTIDCNAAVQPTDTTSDTTPSASGGSVNIVAGFLSGAGTISANGGCGQWNYGGGSGGGRVAVYLTDEDAVFSEKWVANINAYGKSFESGKNTKAASAGTVYLVDGTQDDDSGIIYVRNDLSQARADDNNSVTCIPGIDETCDRAEVLKKTSLYLDGAAKVKLTDSFGSSVLKVANKTKLDLNGKIYEVRRAFINGNKVPVGTYQSGDEPFGEILSDSTGDGMLRVTGYGIWVFVQ